MRPNLVLEIYFVLSLLIDSNIVYHIGKEKARGFARKGTVNHESIKQNG